MQTVDSRPNGVGLLLVTLATACWSASGIFINLIVDATGIPPVSLAFWRDLATFVVLLGVMLILRPGSLRVQRRDLIWLMLMGALSIGAFHAAWVTAVLLNGVSVATVLQCNAPVFVTLMAWLLWKEPLTWQKVLAIGMATVGTVLIARLGNLGGVQISTIGLGISLLSAITYGTFSLFGKKLTGSYDPWAVMVYIFGFGTLSLAPFQIGLPLPFPVSATVLWQFAALTFLTTIVGFGLYTMALQRLPASVAAIAATTEVPFASILSYFVLAERLDGWQIVGALLVVAGVILISYKGRPRRASP